MSHSAVVPDGALQTPQAPDDVPDAFLRATPLIQSDDPAIAAFAATIVAGVVEPIERARRLYYAVRDQIRYDPYAIELSQEGLSASRCLRERVGFCVTKAALFVALARAVRIPARIGFADVRNHLATGRLRALMGTDVFCFHGYADLRLDGRWVKATPTFNIELCERFRVRPLEFDGRSDALLHAFDADDRRHMEYLRFRGTFADVPHATIIPTFLAKYPTMFDGQSVRSRGDFAAEASAERR
ncbi:MAG: transglutaminase family protein [Alphaproteobacteria bacterium]|nr:transglutaminase family protein [Alphaproteobacteria bacterium]